MHTRRAERTRGAGRGTWGAGASARSPAAGCGAYVACVPRAGAALRVAGRAGDVSAALRAAHREWRGSNIKTTHAETFCAQCRSSADARKAHPAAPAHQAFRQHQPLHRGRGWRLGVARRGTICNTRERTRHRAERHDRACGCGTCIDACMYRACVCACMRACVRACVWQLDAAARECGW